MISRRTMKVSLTVTGLACAGLAGAQELDVEKLGEQEIQPASCRAVAWQKELLARYPRIADACQEVVIANGVKFARFTGELRSTHRDGTVTVDFKDRRNASLGRLTLRPAPEQRVLIEGRRYRFADLDRGQELSLYVPEGLYAVATEPGPPPERMAQIVPSETRAPAATTEPARVAQATAAPAARLPDTAGSAPLLVLAGLLAAAGGCALTLRRSLSS